MSLVTVRVDSGKFLAELARLGHDAERRAVETTAAAAKAEATRLLAQKLNTTEKRTGAYTHSERTSTTPPIVTVRIRDLNFIPARGLNPVQTPTGVSYRVPGVVAGQIRSAFIATMGRGGSGGGGRGSTGVFKRTTRPAERRGPKRSYLPIAQQMVSVPAFLPDGLVAFTEKRLAAELERELAKTLPRAGTGR